MNIQGIADAIQRNEAALIELKAMFASMIAQPAPQPAPPAKAEPSCQVLHGSNISPVIFRYVRPMNSYYEPMNLGGVTMAFVINYRRKEAMVGYAITREDENFNKSLGREMALERLYTGDGIVFDYADGTQSLVDALEAALVEHKANLRGRDLTLLERIQAYCDM